mgnify:CR=1 FL=1
MPIKYANDFKTSASDTALRTRKYGKILEVIDLLVDDRRYRAEIRLSSLSGKYLFTGYCPVLPENRMATDGGHHYTSEQCVRISDKDADVVRAGLLVRLRGLVLVVWSPYIHVCVGGSEDYQGLSISKVYVLVGTRPDGSKCHRDRAFICDGHFVHGDAAKKGEWMADGHIDDGLPDIGPVEGPRSTIENYSLIPYDQAVDARLDVIIERLLILRKQVTELITGSDVDKIVSNIMSTNLLGHAAAKETA